ncbi:MAG TPA: hypothetical protein VIJ22_13970 [Polyangiaceae bacterium]
MRVRAPWTMLALTGCVSVAPAPDTGVAPPFNACPAHSCSAYVQTPAPICNGGACLASSLNDLLLVVSLAEESDFAPGQSIALTYGSLPPASIPCTSPTTPCTELPNYAIVQGAYTVASQVQSPPPTGVGWNLGNPGVATALPIHVTYRPLWPPGAPGSAGVDATGINLPFDLIPAFVVVETAPSSPPGPGPGPSIGFQANLQASLLYEATLQPDPPFDAAFPPEVAHVSYVAGTTNDNEPLVPDLTTALAGAPLTGAQIPSFSLARLPDGLAGWQAYLRDVTTKRRLSSLPTLGTRTNDCASSPCTVLLPTNYHPATGVDPLTGTEIVLVPPASASLPTYVAQPIGGEFPYKQTYPVLPAPMAVTGSVTDLTGMPVEAELFFDATGIDAEGPGGLAVNTTNFEYTATTTASFDQGTGAATYSIALPPGQYTVSARPIDAAHQVTQVIAFAVDPVAGATSPDVRVDALRLVQGSASIADLRPMAGAAVEALPTLCATGSSPHCMPRGAATTTAADGTFKLALDPGSYVLRVEPQSGTLFPWVAQTLLVGPTPVTVPPITVPAPVRAGLQLFDPYTNPVVGAVVRVYEVPAMGAAVEVGLALTDATGTCDLYLAPSSQ